MLCCFQYVQQATGAIAEEGARAASAGKKRGDVGLLLPMDYSGMVEGLADGNLLLKEMDGMVRNAIRCQVVSFVEALALPFVVWSHHVG